MARRRADAGILLMEVLIAVAILALGGVFIIRSIINSLDSTQLTQEYSKAMFLTSAKLEELMDQYSLTQSRGGESYGPRDFEDEAGRNFAYEVEIETNSDRLVFEIKVTTIWIHRGMEKRYSLYSEVPMRRLLDDYGR